MKNKILAVFTVVLLSGPSAAFAALINLNLNAVGSAFTLDSGSSTPPPIDPLSIDFSLSFDNATDIARTTLGLTINSFNAPYAVNYAYFAASDVLTLATFSDSGSCANSAGSFCMFFSNVSTAPVFGFAQQSTLANGSWIANRRSLAPSVPVPATLPLIGLGLAALGWSRRKKA